jgi:hypothetical protein
VRANKPANQLGKPKVEQERKPGFPAWRILVNSPQAHRQTAAKPAAIFRGTPLLPVAVVMIKV